MEMATVPVVERKPYFDQMVTHDGNALCTCPNCGTEHEVRAALIAGFRKDGRFLLSCNSRACAEETIRIRKGRK